MSQQPPPYYPPPQKQAGIGTGIKIALGIGIGFLLMMGACITCVGVMSKRVIDEAAKQGSSSSSSSSTASSSTASAGITLAKFNQLKEGMTYAEVVRILGKEGEEISSSNIGNIKTVMYKWDGQGGFGANMNAMFQNGKMVSKAQFGLK